MDASEYVANVMDDAHKEIVEDENVSAGKILELCNFISE